MAYVHITFRECQSVGSVFHKTHKHKPRQKVDRDTHTPRTGSSYSIAHKANLRCVRKIAKSDY